MGKSFDETLINKLKRALDKAASSAQANSPQTVEAIENHEKPNGHSGRAERD